MMEFNEAFEIIGGHDSEFDYCVEYADAFVFSQKGGRSFGGFDSPVVVMKEDGCCISFVDYIGESNGSVVRAGYLEDWASGGRAKKRMKRGGKIDFARVTRMSFSTFSYMCIGSEEEVALEGGLLVLRRGIRMEPEATVPVTLDLAGKLTQMFDACGVSSWRRHYDPEGFMVLDGEGWELVLELDGELVFRADGNNAWPQGFDELKESLVGLFG